MPKQQYPWLLAMTMLAAHQLKNTADVDAEDTGPAWTDITARLGRLQDSSARSANDQVAAVLFVLLLIWWWNSAKYAANISASRSVFCKINAGRFFPDSACIPHQLAVREVSSLALLSDKTSTSPHPV